MNKYTSLELSKKLKEGGCKLSWSHCWTKDHAGARWYVTRSPLIECYKLIPAYDLLWHVCVKYGVEFFGVDFFQPIQHSGSDCDSEGRDYAWDQLEPSMFSDLFDRIKAGDIQETEDFIWKHTLFNQDNQK